MSTTPSVGAGRVVLVSHFHWDREWYRTMQAFRARLVDSIDRVLDLVASDPAFRFLLDGQTVILEDYLVVRPQRRDELVDAIRNGRLVVGPWFVQPDSLLPSGEAHVRNLLEGRRAADEFGAVSSVAYVPDSFGHPAQFPQLFDGFGLTGFVHWRGNGNEFDRLGARWTWRGPDGSTIPVFHLTDGYFAASRPPADETDAVAGLAELARRLKDAGEDPVILMNGFDHTRPDDGISALVEPLAAELDTDVCRGTLDDAVQGATTPEERPEYAGELVGARSANLLAGVWSARTGLKIRNRRIEMLLQNWVEPWTAFGRELGLADESPAVRTAWRSLLLNQAHDSICGCSIDAVHDRMEARYDDAEGLALETVDRLLARVAGRSTDREVPPVDDLEVAAFNGSPQPATGVVRVALDAHPAFPMTLGVPDIHSLVHATTDLGFTVDGVPVRVVASTDPARVRWLPDQQALDVEFVARDVPAFGYRRYRLEPAEPAPDRIDDGNEIEADGRTLTVADDGTITLRTAAGEWSGLFGISDRGDRGDSYDVDPVGDAVVPEPVRTAVVRRRHGSGIQRLTVTRHFDLPIGLDADRAERESATDDVEIEVELTLAAGVEGVHAAVSIDNRVRDHRLRLTFPTGLATTTFSAASTFDVVTRSTDPVDDSTWIHPAPTTFCQQGHVALNGLTVAAPGLPEAEVTPDGTLLLTLVRCVGWLSRWDLHRRPMPAGPVMEAPGAQCIGAQRSELVLLTGAGSGAVERAVTGLRGVIAGPDPVLEAGRPLLGLTSATDDDDHDDAVVLSALKPTDDGDGFIVRLLNPTGQTRTVELSTELAVSTIQRVRLDESPVGDPADFPGTVALTVGAHELSSHRLRGPD